MTEKGFSLVEVLIVLVLTSVLMIMLFSALRTGGDSMRLAEKFTEGVEQQRQLVNLLHRHMRQLVPVTVSPDAESERAFRGREDRIRYVAPLSLSASSEPYLIEINSGLAAQPGTWIRFTRFDPEIDSLAQLEGQSFFQLSSSINLQFRYLEPAAEERRWLEQWENRDDLPRLLEVRLDGANPPLPELVMSVIAARPYLGDEDLRRALEILQGFQPAPS